MTIICPITACAQVHKPSPADTPECQMEKLDRGLTAVRLSYTSDSYYVSWRLFGTDNNTTTFNLLCDGKVIKSDIYKTTGVTVTGSQSSSFQVQTVHDGEVVATSEAVKPWSDIYKTLKLNRPAGASNKSGYYTYTPNDCSVADVDGDGQYEIVVKWDPTDSQDNSISGYTGNVYLDCYEFDGTQLWRIDLGKNIRAGAHYTQFLVYDFDKDGKAEVICKTAPGSIDGTGSYVSAVGCDDNIINTDNSKDYRNSKGFVITGPEFLTVFNGQTGKAINTIWYQPNRGKEIRSSAAASLANWGKSDNGNRADRFLASVAYLGGQDENPSAVMCRGYYTYAYVWAVDYDGTKLSQRWLHQSTATDSYYLLTGDASNKATSVSSNTSGMGTLYTLYGNGNHNMSVADVDGDGKDEILYGSAALDDDGKLLYAVGYGHGDAMHVSDIDPDRDGLEVFDVHEEDVDPFGEDLHDAATGEVIFNKLGITDNGRGLAADLIPDATNRGLEFWSSNYRDLYNVKGSVASSKHVSVNFRTYWNGDAQDELFDGSYSSKTLVSSPSIAYWNGNGTSKSIVFSNYDNSQSCNTTKSTPNLQADIFGDWREEVILWNGTDSCSLNIFSTTAETDYRVPCLMHDHTYRMGISWQQTAYNQPPHLGYYLPDYIDSFIGVNPATGINDINADSNDESIVVKREYFTIDGEKIDKQNLTSGVYILKSFYDNGKITSMKFVKK